MDTLKDILAMFVAFWLPVGLTMLAYGFVG